MDIGEYLSQGMKRMGGGDWESAQCVEKIQEMLTRAIRDQEDMWKILVSTSSTAAELGETAGGSQFGDKVQLEAGCSEQKPQMTTCSRELVPARILRPLMAKIENSLDWCHLALCRIKEFGSIAQSPTATITRQQAAGASIPRYPNLQAHELEPSFHVVHPTSSNLKLHAPLSALRIPRAKEDLDLLDGATSFPMNHFLGYSRGTTSATLADQSDDETGGQDHSLSMLASDLEPTQGPNIKGIPELGMETNWPHLETDSAMDIGAEGHNNGVLQNVQELEETSKTFPRSLSTNMLYLKRAESEPCIQDNSSDAGGKLMTRSRSMTSRRNPNRLKRDREVAADGGDEEPAEHVVVSYQRLRPGVDSKKAIPQDGHRGWKKYGKKCIQNAVFCRGYYKCSVKDCNAKKTVQPTNEDPSLFEVTYAGTHTCKYMSTYPRKKQQRGRDPNHLPAVAAVAAEVPDHIVTLDHHDQFSKIAATDEESAAPACDEKLLMEPEASIAASSAKDGTDVEEDVAGPETPGNEVLVLDLPSTAASEAAVEEKVALATDVEAKSSSKSLAVLATTAGTGRHAVEPTSSADLESLEAISTDSSKLESHEDSWKAFALQAQQPAASDQSIAVDMDSYISSTVASLAGGLTLNDLEGYATDLHHDHVQQQLHYADQAYPFQPDSMFDWSDLMDNKLFSN